tara:strand:+ start:992 stop:1282 length:291 start_codon:yes stop_codon:yes gene_type:complete
MAEFSKEYCQIWDPGFPYDFSVEQIAKDLHKGNYYPIICEGFSFVAIAKDRNEQILVAFQDEESDRIVWQDFDNFMNSQYKLLEEEVKIDQENKVF